MSCFYLRLTLVVLLLIFLSNEVNKTKSLELASLLKNLGNVLGLLQRDASEFLQGKHYELNLEPGEYRSSGSEAKFKFGDNDKNIDEMIFLRAEAKKAKNFTEADRIRKELIDQGILLEDGPSGTIWRRT